MKQENIFDQLDFDENPLFERIISDLLSKHFSVVDSFFSEEEVTTLRNCLLLRYHDDAFKKSAIGNKTNENIITSIRGDYIYWLDERTINEAEKVFFNKINALISYLNKTCFLGILHKEFHYAIYPKGTFYKRHLDTFMNDDRRKLSFVCYLNDSYWRKENGGELVIYTQENKTETAHTIHPLPGRVVVFESQLLEHEVKQVKQSERYSITGWLKTR